ncbi:class I SAM-dependent methyltransferase [Paenibacillus sp. GYB003]|uniref:class I SAM-dependent methyltransferase n=1 Tax=Paenibacillus sp. GYB003 TaxID=2994392 RepID=UPI002F9648E1
MSDHFESRFILETDPRTNRFVYDLPDAWWSRLYEYEWAGRFANAADVVLDAACGIPHPLKFYLSDVCKEVHACDLDGRIASAELMRQAVAAELGPDIYAAMPDHYFDGIRYAQANLASLPYEERKFDKIFCISVLEHMQWDDIVRALSEFHRVLKDDGLLVVTFDYPTISLPRLDEALKLTGFGYYGARSTEKPAHALRSTMWGELYCYRAVLAKRQPE